MTTPVIILCVIIALLIAGFAAYLFWAQRKFGELEAAAAKKQDAQPLALTAYERLTLYAERMRLSNLVNRLHQPGLSAREMQVALLNALRDEYDHNITQQLYVRKEIWDAITRMKDQNMYIINQVAATLPAEATAMDLNRQLLELAANHPDATLNQTILDAIQHEVKQLM